MRRLLLIAVLGANLVVSHSACRSAGRGDDGDQLQSLRDEVAVVIADGDRREAMLADIERMEAALVDLGAVVEHHRRIVVEQLRDYDTTRPEINRALDGYLLERQQVIDRLVAAHFHFKKQARPEEWKYLAKKEKAAVAWAAHRHLGEAPLDEL